MAVSWSVNTSTYNETSGSGQYVIITEHKISVEFSAYSSSSIFFDSMNPNGVFHKLNLSNSETIMGGYVEQSAKDFLPDGYGVNLSRPIYFANPASSGSGSPGLLTEYHGYAVDGSGDIFCLAEKFIIELNGAVPSTLTTVLGTGIWAIEIPSGVQGLFSDYFIVPPTHYLFNAGSGWVSTAASGIGFARYQESITAEAKYLLSSYDARINKKDLSGIYVAHYPNGDVYAEYYDIIGQPVYETTVGGRIIASHVDYYPAVAPTSFEASIQYLSKTGAVLGTDLKTSTYSPLITDVYVSEIDARLSFPPLTAFVNWTLNGSGATSSRIIVHPGYSPIPCQEVDGGWVPGVLWKIS